MADRPTVEEAVARVRHLVEDTVTRHLDPAEALVSAMQRKVDMLVGRTVVVLVDDQPTEAVVREVGTVRLVDSHHVEVPLRLLPKHPLIEITVTTEAID